MRMIRWLFRRVVLIIPMSRNRGRTWSASGIPTSVTCAVVFRTVAADSGPASGVQPKILGPRLVVTTIRQCHGSDLFGYTSGSPTEWGWHGYRAFVPADDNSYIGDIIELQISVASTASNGALSAETLTLAWDEVCIYGTLNEICYSLQ